MIISLFKLSSFKKTFIASIFMVILSLAGLKLNIDYKQILNGSKICRFLRSLFLVGEGGKEDGGEY